MGKATKAERDIYYRRAKESSYRARSAYKLLDVDQEFNIFQTRDGGRVLRVVDLAAAPGSWSQVICEKLSADRGTQKGKEEAKGDEGARVVAVDLQEMAPIEGVDCIQGDITSMATVKEIGRRFKGNRVDLVVCDGAPDVTGLNDEAVQRSLVIAALRITTCLLREGGTFVAKVFKGNQSAYLHMTLLLFFEKVSTFKPNSSRIDSAEHFVVCEGLQIPPSFDVHLESDIDVFDAFLRRQICPFAHEGSPQEANAAEVGGSV